MIALRARAIRLADFADAAINDRYALINAVLILKGLV